MGSVSYYGFFGFTSGHLLIALLHGVKKEINWVSRVPLDIKTVKIRRSLIPGQYILVIKFNEGNPFKARISKWVYGIDCQRENVGQFIDRLKMGAGR